MFFRLVIGIVAIALLAVAYQVYQLVNTPPWKPAIAPAPAMAAKPRTPCADHNPLRNAYFGDLHVHTTLSWDGAGRGMRTTPDQAYRFATGDKLRLTPYDNNGVGTRSVQLERPLDFAAVTDHAESIGEVYLCVTPGSARYNDNICRTLRGDDASSPLSMFDSPLRVIKANVRSEALCDTDASLCRDATISAWRSIQQAAEDWYDRSSECSFTTFHGYEYSYAPWANRAHRNVIFRNEVVPELPVSAHDAERPLQLWEQLQALCLDTDGDCDVITIPHNPNHASGMMFPVSDPSEATEVRLHRAQLSAQFEPLVEMMQIKGESECRNGLWGVVGAPDEFCNFEKYSPPNIDDCESGTGIGFALGMGCVARTNFARYAIAAGLHEERQLGVNPYRLGFIGSTDNHNGAPGAVEDTKFAGSRGTKDDSLKKRFKSQNINPGGLVGVWAAENSREALFDAMRRREVFATSGPRIKVRFFASAEPFATADGTHWCEQRNGIQRAYDVGIPMGETLSGRIENTESPYFAVQAVQDTGTQQQPGNLLQRMQIIKVQSLPNGEFKQQVYDVAGGANDATVDPHSCATSGPGESSLCSVWRDPDFNPGDSTAYYARVIENPSCRWTHWSCINTPEAERPAACATPITPEITQQRAWSSPIWYSP